MYVYICELSSSPVWFLTHLALCRSLRSNMLASRASKLHSPELLVCCHDARHLPEVLGDPTVRTFELLFLVRVTVQPYIYICIYIYIYI